MKQGIKAILVFSISLFWATSCGPATPAPTVTATASMTPTANVQTSLPLLLNDPAPTPQPTPSLRLWNQLPPKQPVDKYKLAAWDDKLPANIGHILAQAASEYYPYLKMAHDYQAAFELETWSRVQSDQERKTHLCKLLFEDPGTSAVPGLRPEQDLFSVFVENLINQDGVAVDNLPEEFINRFSDGCLGVFSLNQAGNIYFQPAPVKNLFGDSQDAYVFAVGTVFDEPNRVAVYAAHRVDGLMRVEKVRDWEKHSSVASVKQFKFFDIGDINNDGVNELAMDYSYGNSGYPTQSGEWLYRYEWDSNLKTFKGGDEVEIFAQSCNLGPCQGEWKFAPASAEGNISLTAHAVYFYIPGPV